MTRINELQKVIGFKQGVVSIKPFKNKIDDLSFSPAPLGWI